MAPKKRPASALNGSVGMSGGREAKLMKLGKPISTFKKKISLDALEHEAVRVGFDARSYMENGFTVLPGRLCTDEELDKCLAAARRVREGRGSEASNAGGEFVFMPRVSSPDKMLLFSLINRYTPFLHQLLNGIKLPGSDKGPFSHHNAIQVAVKKPGFEGYAKLKKMSDASVGHIDQRAMKQTSGKPTTNYSVLLGVVLGGDTEDRDDAGNLYLAPKSHVQLASKFKECTGSGPVPWHREVAKHYLGRAAPKMKAVRAKPGQCILMHHQTIHGVGPNHSAADRVHIYFRVQSSSRPDGTCTWYPEAMRDPMLEMPLVHQLAERQGAR